MNDTQRYYGENARWIIRETYFGKFDDTRVICTCHTLSDARMIIDALVKANKGRTYEYKAEKIAEDYIAVCDDVYETDLFTGETFNYTKYINGVSCLG